MDIGGLVDKVLSIVERERGVRLPRRDVVYPPSASVSAYFPRYVDITASKKEGCVVGYNNHEDAAHSVGLKGKRRADGISMAIRRNLRAGDHVWAYGSEVHAEGGVDAYLSKKAGAFTKVKRKLSDQDVVDIFTSNDSAPLSAARYNVAAATIRGIWARRKRAKVTAHLPDRRPQR